MKSKDLRTRLQSLAPSLWSQIDSIATEWTKGVEENLEQRSEIPTAFPKTFTDPILGPVELYEWEFILLDSPLLQRLRGIRQLGMGHAVYTSAVHDRLSHCLGVVEVASRMIQSLAKNAIHRKFYGVQRDGNLPAPSEADRFSIRLAALLHDIGHAPFSHASELLVKERAGEELEKVIDFLRDEFEGTQQIKTSEAIAVLVILSEPLRRIFEHSRFAIPFERRDELAPTISARILGSRKYIDALYLSGIVSGTVDADKLDYMARDSYFTGLPIGLDVNRLISKLEIIAITPENVADLELKKRAEAAKNKTLYQLGISLSGLTAYEQMIVGRVLLYDRVYYHHKVRCGEAMARRLFQIAEEERGRAFSLPELFSNVSDDAMVYLLSGEMKIDPLEGGKERSAKLGEAMRTRHLYHRCYAFAERFIAGLDSLPEEDQSMTRSGLWTDVREGLNESKLSKEIFEISVKLIEKIPELNKHKREFRPEDVLVDLPDDRVTAPGRKLLMRTEGGGLTDANMFFNPEKWSQAFKNQKQCGYVFAPREYTEAVAIASQIAFQQKFGVVMRREAQHLCKIEHLLSDNWVKWMTLALDAGICTPECFQCLTEERPKFILFRANQIVLPPEWVKEDPGIKERLAQEFFNSSPGGLISSLHASVLKALENLCYVLDAFEKNGTFVSDKKPDEKKDLQGKLLEALRLRGVEADEATQIGGGETDVILSGKLVVENKVADVTQDPKNLKPDADWQSRRYSIAFNRRVNFVIIAYKPANEAAFLPLPSRISIYPLKNSPEVCAVVRLLVPWGYKTPSKAKAC
jgi:HD superfamily phosphohydrolase